MAKRNQRRRTPQPKPKPTAAVTPPDEVEEVVEAPPAEEGFVAPHWEYSLLEVETSPVDERDLRALMRTWRRGRATTNIRQVLQDGYVAVFAIVLVGAMLISAIIRGQGIVADCATAECLTGRTLLPWAVLFGSLAATLLVSRLFGPVLASAAEGFWLMEAPIRRSRLLRGRLAAILAGVFAAGAAIGALVAALTGWGATGIVAWTLATGLGAVGLTAFAAAEQGADRRWTVRTVQWLVAAGCLGSLATVVSVAAGWIAVPIDDLAGVELAFVVAAVGLVLLVVAGMIAFRRLDQIRRARLVSGGALVEGMQGAAFALDLGLMRDILVDRDAAARGNVRPRRGRGLGRAALVWREVQRLGRYPSRLVMLVVSLIVPYAVGALGLAQLNPLLSGAVLMGGIIPLMNSLRVLSRTKGLARSFPFTQQQVRTSLMVVPAVLTLVWVAIVTPAFHGLGSGRVLLSWPDAIMYAGVTGIAGLLGAVRWLAAKPVNFSNPMMQTGFGAMPPGLVFNLLRGFDILIITTGPIIIGWSPFISLVIAGIAYIVLTGNWDAEEMQAMQAQQQKEMAEAKARAKGVAPGKPTSATKQRITPPKR